MNLAKKIWNSFRGGRYTRSNIANISDDHVLVAKNVIFPGDGVAHKCPGYTLVKATGTSDGAECSTFSGSLTARNMC
jgi:hypothetical protein